MESQAFIYSIVNGGLAFVEGFALIFSPCILPILPIVLSSSIEGGSKRSWGIICGFVLTFALFAFFSRVLVQHLGINLDFLRKIAYFMIVGFGIILFSDYLSDKFSFYTRKIAALGENVELPNSRMYFWSGLILGAAISLIWVPCGGPILAAAIVQSAVQQTNWQSFITFFFFALGSVTPMIIIAFIGKKWISHIGYLKTKTALLRKIFGLIIIVSAMIASFMTTSSGFSIAQSKKEPSVAGASATLEGGLLIPYRAPSFGRVDGWINTEPFTMESLKGKVVLIDFWTYSCINCIRTLPYLKEWYKKYHDQGFVVVGVHAPEFEFEKNFDNVKAAVSQFEIQYPVILDNHYGTWLNFKNQYWPAHYLIDKNGMVVYEHFGEGHYDTTEHNIVVLLGIKEKPNTASSNDTNLSFDLNQTPETYLGYERSRSYSGEGSYAHDAIMNYQFPNSIPQNGWALQGKWQINPDKIIAEESGAQLKLHFYAKKVYIVMGSQNNEPISVKVLLNDEPIDTVKITRSTLYEVIHLQAPKSGTVTLIPESAGAEFFAFTFGN